MKNKTQGNRLFGLAVALLLTLFFSGHLQAADLIEPSRFISPETCAGCHSDIYSQWENSTHSLAHTDPIYNAVAAFFLKGLTEAGADLAPRDVLTDAGEAGDYTR